jgi:adenylate kinase
MNQSNDPALFDNDNNRGIRVVITGQVGLNKKAFLEQVAEIGRQNGHEIDIINVGERMYAEAPDVVSGRILDLPLKRLEQLRRSVFKDVVAKAQAGGHVIVNTHATFRWKHGLFHALDHCDMVKFDADLYITLIDNMDVIHDRLIHDHEDIGHTLKDILVWREEEIVVSQAMAEAVKGYGHCYVVTRGDAKLTAETVYRLMFEPQRKRVYPSFPMTHVMNMPNVLAEIDHFRRRLNEHFITFDPGEVDEKDLLFKAGAATQRGETEITIRVNDHDLTLQVRDVCEVAQDIDAQIYARDFMLIDQSHIIVSYIPELPDGKPGLSSGVERELQHAFEGTKEVFVVWNPKAEPSPFITATATKVFPNIDTLFAFFKERGYIGEFQPDLLRISSSQQPKS